MTAKFCLTALSVSAVALTEYGRADTNQRGTFGNGRLHIRAHSHGQRVHARVSCLQ